MKLHELQKKVRSDKRFIKARNELRKDIAFQMGHEVEKLRLALDLSQAQFAEKVGMQQPAIARLERGSVVPSLPILQKIGHAVGRKLILPTFAGTQSSTVITDSLDKRITSFVSPYFPRTEIAATNTASQSDDKS